MKCLFTKIDKKMVLEILEPQLLNLNLDYVCPECNSILDFFGLFDLQKFSLEEINKIKANIKNGNLKNQEFENIIKNTINKHKDSMLDLILGCPKCWLYLVSDSSPYKKSVLRFISKNKILKTKIYNNPFQTQTDGTS